MREKAPFERELFCFPREMQFFLASVAIIQYNQIIFTALPVDKRDI